MLRIFISYSHADELLKQQLEVHLAMLKRKNVIDVWNDRRLTPGSDLHGEISQNLESADVFLLLVSPDFLNSSYCWDKEVGRAMERHGAGQATVLPVILRPCDWKDTPFGGLLAVPKDGKPISKYADKDDAFLEVVEAIKGIASERDSTESSKQSKHTKGRSSSEPPQATKPERPRSSNLRVKRIYSDRDKDKFYDDAFKYIANFFEASLEELYSREEGIETRFKRESSTRFLATIYRGGQEVSSCAIWLADHSTFSQGIMYCPTPQFGNGYTESLSVDDDGYAMYLKRTMSMLSSGDDSRNKLTFEGAAEAYWEMLIGRLQ